MKKFMKAAIATGAAGALLLGGAGTMALWSANDTIDAGTVSTGHLTLEAVGVGTWADATEGAATTVFTPATDHLVPGDTVTYSQTVSIAADGKNLKGTLDVTGLTGEDALPEDVTVDVQVDRNAAGIVEDENNVITFGEAATYEVPVVITLSFAEGATGTMDTPLDLGSMTLTLTQVANAAPAV